MSDTDRSSIASMATLPISGSSCVIHDSPGNDQAPNSLPRTTKPIPTGPGTSQDKVAAAKPELDIPSAAPSNPGMLTMVLVSKKDKETEERYAVVPFPEIYEAAVIAAVKALGRYMTDPRPDNVILRCSTKNRNDKWVWADIPPENWKMTLGLEHTKVGIFEKRQKVISRDLAFIHGKVLATFGRRRDGETTWTSKLLASKVDRPKTYSEAVETMKTNHPRFGRADFQRSGNFRFYIFPAGNLKVWLAIPLEAHSDDNMWRTLVPNPGGILGVIGE